MIIFVGRPGQPRNLTVTKVTYNSITFRWDEPHEDAGGSVKWYKFRTVEGADSDCPDRVRTVTLKREQREVTIDSLEHERILYEFRVAAKNKQGTGPFLSCKQPIIHFISVKIQGHKIFRLITHSFL
jgi:hypothetical protein